MLPHECMCPESPANRPMIIIAHEQPLDADRQQVAAARSARSSASGCTGRRSAPIAALIGAACAGEVGVLAGTSRRTRRAPAPSAAARTSRQFAQHVAHARLVRRPRGGVEALLVLQRHRRVDRAMNSAIATNQMLKSSTSCASNGSIMRVTRRRRRHHLDDLRPAHDEEDRDRRSRCRSACESSPSTQSVTISVTCPPTITMNTVHDEVARP